MTNINKLRKVIKKQINEQILKRPKPDLSKIEKSFTHWLESHLKEIDQKKLQNNPEELIQYLSDARNQGVHVSQTYLEKLADGIKRIKSPSQILKYLYNVYLKGSSLGLTEGKKIKKKLKSNSLKESVDIKTAARDIAKNYKRITGTDPKKLIDNRGEFNQTLVDKDFNKIQKYVSKNYPDFGELKGEEDLLFAIDDELLNLRF